MAEQRPTAVSLTRQAIEAFERDDVATARRLLGEALHLDEKHEPAWAWLAFLAEDDGHRRYCLEKALEAKPDRATVRALATLRRVKATPPPEVADLSAPPRPPSLTSRTTPPRQRPIPWKSVALGMVLVLLFVAGYLLLVPGPEPVYFALVTSRTGDTGSTIEDTVRGVQFHIGEVNHAGGINGHPVEIKVYDDGDNVERAKEIAKEIVADGRMLAVIGHRRSNTSAVAGPIYAAAKIPAITSTATSDAITATNPWYFRTVFNNATQGEFSAAYARYVMATKDISIIHGDRDYGQNFREGFASAFTRDGGQVWHDLTVSLIPEQQDATISAAVTTLKAQPPTWPLVIAVQEDVAKKIIQAVRSQGINVPILGGDTMSSKSFFEALQALPEEQQHPGSLTHDVSAAAPLIADSLSGRALRWMESFQRTYGYVPSWRAFTSYEASTALVHALRTGETALKAATRAADRERIRQRLTAMQDPDSGIEGLTAKLYFDTTRSVSRPVTIGVFHDGSFVSAPVQLVSGADAAGVKPGGALSGDTIRFGDHALVRQRIVATGINLNEIGHLDIRTRTFFADFYLWFKYTGDDTITDIIFVNADDAKLALGTPLRSSHVNSVQYRLYRVAAKFKTQLNFRLFPFDQQNLRIILQNRTMPSTRVLYVTDPLILSQTTADILRSGTDVKEDVNRIPSWTPIDAKLHADTVGSSAEMADPSFSRGDAPVFYGQYVADLTIARDLRGFLVKNLLPLVLLACVVYISLFIPFEQAGNRISIGITGILSTAVLLTSVTNALPEVSYTVTIEWAYYAFIFLAVTCVLLALIGWHWHSDNRVAALRRLTFASRVYYPAYVAAVVVLYLWKFG